MTQSGSSFPQWSVLGSDRGLNQTSQLSPVSKNSSKSRLKLDLLHSVSSPQGADVVNEKEEEDVNLTGASQCPADSVELLLQLCAVLRLISREHSILPVLCRRKGGSDKMRKCKRHEKKYSCDRSTTATRLETCCRMLW
ncbi:unnamed protein product [Pleuronectes platessa]|uniref:Uncharacterized protein n=1 Tax=Pleuronectes platessa TaxID=8262 RepID=A0A9N7YES5_PLEPL|nr:unnamed protein product [Pleuronectes platessa]